MRCQNLSMMYHISLCPAPDGALALTSGSTAVGGAAVPVAGSAVQGIQLVLQAQEGGAHPLQHTHHLLRGRAWRGRTVGERPGRPFSQPNLTSEGGVSLGPCALQASGHIPPEHGSIPPAAVASGASGGSAGAARLRFRPVTETLATLGQAAAVVSASGDMDDSLRDGLAGQGSSAAWTPPWWPGSSHLNRQVLSVCCIQGKRGSLGEDRTTNSPQSSGSWAGLGKPGRACPEVLIVTVSPDGAPPSPPGSFQPEGGLVWQTPASRSHLSVSGGARPPAEG